MSLLKTIANAHSLRAESARRAIIFLFLIYAMAHEYPDGPLKMDEEAALSAILDVGTERIKYHGQVDFIIGHSMEHHRYEGMKLPGNSCFVPGIKYL